MKSSSTELFSFFRSKYQRFFKKYGILDLEESEVISRNNFQKRLKILKLQLLRVRKKPSTKKKQRLSLLDARLAHTAGSLLVSQQLSQLKQKLISILLILKKQISQTHYKPSAQLTVFKLSLDFCMSNPVKSLFVATLPCQKKKLKHSLINKKMRLGQKSQPLNCLWIVEQDAVVEWALLR